MEMKTYTSEEIKEIAAKHLKWLIGEIGGERADFRGADLSGADLRCANLRDADLRGADLSDADLRCANLSYANLSNADLSDVNLRDVNLRGADLRCANLRDADLRGADLRDADLRDADLRDAIGNGKEIVSYTSLWTVVMRHGMIRIGCKEYKAAKWKSFSDEEIAKMDVDALTWWKIHKPIVIAMYEAHFGKIVEEI